MNKHGGIYVSNGNVVTSVAAAPVRLGGFNTSMIYDGVVPTPSDNSIKVRVPGSYMLMGNVILESTDDVFDIVKVELYKNNIPTGFIAGGNLSGGVSGSTISSENSFDTFTGLSGRFLDQNVHGAFQSLAVDQPLSTGVDINVTKGTGKIVIVINAGGDVTGTVTITGDTVDRETGAVTVGDSEDITIAGLSTDTSDTDAEGNVRHAIEDGYITSKWFRGAIVLSTTTLTLTDVDVYHCSFEQFNDTGTIMLDTFDINCFPTNTAAWLFSYLYTVDVVGSLVTIHRVSSLEIPVGISEADNYYRLRKTNLAHTLDASTSGIFVEINEGPDNLQYWEDITVKVWYTRTNIINPPATAFAVAIPIQGLLDLNKNDVVSLYAYTAQGNSINVTLSSGSLVLFSK